MEELAIVIPVYNEQETIEIFIREVNNKTENLELKKVFYFVNDGSTDQTLPLLKKIAKQHGNINYISFSRNFGKEAALLAGLQATKESLVTVMDVDLQDPPELLVSMYYKLLEGYDSVGARRISRKGEPWINSLFSRFFYKIVNKVSTTPIVEGARDFRLMTRQVVDSILELRESNRFSKGLFSWVGYEVTYLEYENHERSAGQTSWSFRQLLSYSIDGIINFSETPLNIATFVGFISFLASVLLSIFYLLKTLIFGDPVQGFPTLIVLILLLGGLQLLSLGIIGKYIAKIFLETKRRPNYIIKESNIKELD
ncbi:Bactoprenol glucosyl transferase [Lactococcus cremoris]|uniref:Bactoprenol glucosyl transferase n=1 Tax=Lactococcus lactis subsp. cremoris TaxID=1359 RepID=A0A166JV12_LACLC|nr:glycosyltransferase family 2 protein [Lactococcus cremoris]KZK06936.1 Bactoprenol glucosyl transferase [Lactococcus cremoris]